VEAWLHAFLTSELDGFEYSDSRSGSFNHGERSGTHFMEGCVGLRAILNTVAKTKSSFLALVGNRTSVIQPIAHV